MKILQPPSWARPRGFSNGVAAKGQVIFVSGMVGWDAEGKFVSNEFVGQARQALKNIVEVLAEAKAKPEHIARMTWYVIRQERISRSVKRTGRRVSRNNRRSLPGDDGCRGGGIDRRSGKGRDRSDGSDSRLNSRT